MKQAGEEGRHPPLAGAPGMAGTAVVRVTAARVGRSFHCWDRREILDRVRSRAQIEDYLIAIVQNTELSIDHAWPKLRAVMARLDLLR